MSVNSHQARYDVLLRLLKKAREDAGVTQIELAKRLKNTQTFVSKVERGERRLDVIDLIDLLEALGSNPQSFVKLLLSEIASDSNRK